MAKFIATLIGTIAALFVLSFFLMLSWNAVIPSLFELRELDFSAAFALLAVVFILSRVAQPMRPEEEKKPVIVARVPEAFKR
jgi:hypothetical protein